MSIDEISLAGLSVPENSMFHALVYGDPVCSDPVCGDPVCGDTDYDGSWFDDSSAAFMDRVAADCDDDCDVEPPIPAWIAEAELANYCESLNKCAHNDLDSAGFAAADALLALGTMDLGALAESGHGGALLDGIVAAQRIVGFAQALQQRWIAAFARPDVAVPLAAVAESVANHMAEKFGIEVPGYDDLSSEGEVLDGGPAAPSDSEPASEPEPSSSSVSESLSRSIWTRELAETAAQVASAEIGCALHWSPITARMRVATALSMVDDLPATLAAQQRGALDGYRASIIADRTQVLAHEQRLAVERRILPTAADRTAAELRRVADREVIAIDPAAAARRARTARANRGVSVYSDSDDMAVFRAHLAAPDAVLAHGVLDTIATSLRSAGVADGRGSSQLRADAFVDLFRSLATTGHAHIAVRDRHAQGTDSTSSATEVVSARNTSEVVSARNATEVVSARGGERRAQGRNLGAVAGVRRPVALNVYIGEATLAGYDNSPGELEGFGAITADTARALAASAETVRALIVRRSTPNDGSDLDGGVEPRRQGNFSREPRNVRKRTCGTILDAGRAVYRPPDATADYVSARDRHCQFPGCRAPINRCDLDHRQPFEQDGITCPCNLDALCRAHHRLKTFTPWSATPGADGRLIWTSPTGRRYEPTPSHLLPDPLAAQPVRRTVIDHAPASVSPFASAPSTAPPSTPRPAADAANGLKMTDPPPF